MTASWDLTVEFITLLGYSITSYPKFSATHTLPGLKKGGKHVLQF